MQSNILETIDIRQLGTELKKARERRKLTQEDAAKVLNVARTTITAIEKGERRIKADELIKLAKAYGRQVSDFVRPRPVVEPYAAQLRGPFWRSEEDKEALGPYIAILEDLARDYLELEERLNAPLVRKYPPQYEVAGLPTDEAAESVAIEERNRLGLGDGPIPILRTILEQDVGLRIFYIEMRPSNKFSAIYFYDEQLGGCIAINSLHPEERRRWSLAHDYAHFLAHRYKPTILIEDQYQRRPESERFADAFALAFLMPESGLRRRFNDVRRTRNKVTPADLCILAHYYGVSVEALTRRLEDMNFLPVGLWDKLREGGFKVREAQHQLGLGPIDAQDHFLPVRYQYLAVDAFEQGLISEGQLARFLHVDRLEARRIADILRQGASSEANSGAGLDVVQQAGV